MVKAEAEQQTTEAQLEGALKSRIQHFRDNASSLNLVSIRRLLEEDLGLEKHALDVHKSFVKQFIDKNLHADGDNDSKKASGKVRKEINSTVKKDKDLSGVSHGDEVKKEEDSPIMGVLTTKTELAGSQGIEISEDMIKKAIQERADYIRSQSETLTLAKARRYLEEELKLSKDDLDPFKKFIRQEIESVIESGVVSTSAMVTKKGSSENRQNKIEETGEKDKDLSGLSHRDEAKMEEDSSLMGILTTKTELARSQGIEISEDMIKKAIQERADYFRSQSESLTLAKARQYLEEELKLGKNALDPFKKFISQEIEAVIDSGVVSTPAMVTKKGSSRNRQSKTEESTGEGSSDSMDSENVAEDHKAKTREKPIQRGEAKKREGEKKRKIPEKTDVSGKKQRMLANKQSKENGDADNDGGVSEDGESQSSVEKPAKKKEAPTPTFGKHVEQLKSVIKACGMSIAPTVYKKAKQVPDSKRETFLIKELEGILSKEGLSKNPSEKEIKEVRKRKERAKELEGIDMSNIITSSRRRSTMSFVPPPRPKKKDEGGDDAINTKMDKDDNKDAKKKEKKSDSKDAKTKKEDGSKDASKKEEDDDGEDAKKKEKDVDDDDDEEEKEEEEKEEEEEEEEDEEEEEEEEDDSQSEEFNDDDEDSD